MNFERSEAIARCVAMDEDQHAKSLKSLAENQRWLDKHPNQTLHKGDLPISTPTKEPTSEQKTKDQQQ